MLPYPTAAINREMHGNIRTANSKCFPVQNKYCLFTNSLSAAGERGQGLSHLLSSLDDAHATSTKDHHRPFQRNSWSWVLSHCEVGRTDGMELDKAAAGAALQYNKEGERSAK